MADVNPLEIYRRHFGVVGLPGFRADVARVDILQRAAEAPPARVDVSSAPGFAATPQQGVAEHYLNTPLFMPCTINGWLLPIEPLVSISGSSSIVRTPLPCWPGTVKENMGLDDYAITIRGVVLNEGSDDYPEADVLLLRSLCERGEPLDIQCPVLQLFNVNRFVIESFRFPADEGVQHYQAYELVGYSDFDLEVLIKDDLDSISPRPRR